MNKIILCRIFVVSIIFLVFLSPLTVLNVSSQEENSWTTLAPMQRGRLGLGVVSINNKIYAIGGYIAESSYIDTNEEYNPTTNTWKYKTSMPTPMGHFAIAVYQNKIYCISSENGAVEVYDPTTDSWENKTSLPSPRLYIKANVIEDKLYVLGGNTRTINVYDFQTDSWSTAERMPVTPGECASVVLNNKIHVFSSPILHQIYDLETNSWEEESLLLGCYYPIATATTGIASPQRIYVFSATYSNSLGTYYGPPTAGQSYDPKTGNWTALNSVPWGHLSGGATVIKDRIYLVGGGSPNYIGTLDAKNVNDAFTPFQYGSIPQVSIISPENKIYAKSSIPLKFLVNDSLAWMGYSLDDQENVTINSGDYWFSAENLFGANLTQLSEGTHQLTVYGRDWVGDEGSSIVTFTADVFPPVVFVLSPENKTYSDFNILLNVEFEEQISDMKYSLDGFVNVTFTEDITLSELEVGSHNISVYATDLAGHTGVSETIYFTIESFPTTLIISAVAIIVVVGLGILLYLKKYKK